MSICSAPAWDRRAPRRERPSSPGRRAPLRVSHAHRVSSKDAARGRPAPRQQVQVADDPRHRRRGVDRGRDQRGLSRIRGSILESIERRGRRTSWSRASTSTTSDRERRQPPGVDGQRSHHGRGDPRSKLDAVRAASWTAASATSAPETGGSPPSMSPPRASAGGTTLGGRWSRDGTSSPPTSPPRAPSPSSPAPLARELFDDLDRSGAAIGCGHALHHRRLRPRRTSSAARTVLPVVPYTPRSSTSGST